VLQHKVRHNQVRQGLDLANQGVSNDRQVSDRLQLVYQRQHLELVQVELLQLIQLLQQLRFQLLELL
jgi:hypothetical protein